MTAIAVLCLIVIGLIAWQLIARHRAGGTEGRGRPAATVGIAKVVPADMPIDLHAIGTVQATVSATVRSQLSGTLFGLHFTEGQMVQKGQLLAEIDPRPYRLALAQAEADLARDRAQLNLAKLDLERYRTLFAQDSIARQQVETQNATVKQLQGTVAADEAAIGTAKLNLGYTAIIAPVSGRIGLRQVDIGNFVTPGDSTGIAVITQTRPIDVGFTLPQGQIAAVRRRLETGATLAVTALDQDGKSVIASGRFQTFDNVIDATSGTIRAKASFANDDDTLFPNQFVNATVHVDTLHDALTVPISATRHGANGDFVFVLQADRTVKLQPVALGPSDGRKIAILSGLHAGATVITEGADNLDDGSRVTLAGDKPHGGQGGSKQAGAQHSGKRSDKRQ